MPDRYARLRLIRQLDPEKDCEEIFRQVTDYEFPWDYWQSASLAFFRTFGVPSIAELLHRTGEFSNRTQKRADDTLLILYEITHHGLEDERGRAFLRRMNRMHRHYNISNDDHRYIIALYIVVPVRWIGRYGWRQLTDHEKRAMTAVGRRLGELMGIKDLPRTFDEFARLADEYEAMNFAYTKAGKRLSSAAMDIAADVLPPRMRPLMKAPMQRFSRALLDEDLLRTVGLPLPSRWERKTAEAVLKFRAFVLRGFPPRPDDRPYRPALVTYPSGYQLQDLGPEWLNSRDQTLR
ncbi:oxygenase MpaB family protein [Streptomyces sp. NPDC048297]|uniref:oxygenase MpaB family protein n=1 Tax=Streptomyces sp. NPDC048297 TaxID=3365531 RepID=UPI0037158CAE